MLHPCVCVLSIHLKAFLCLPVIPFHRGTRNGMQSVDAPIRPGKQRHFHQSTLRLVCRHRKKGAGSRRTFGPRSISAALVRLHREVFHLECPLVPKVCEVAQQSKHPAVQALYRERRPLYRERPQTRPPCCLVAHSQPVEPADTRVRSISWSIWKRLYGTVHGYRYTDKTNTVPAVLYTLVQECTLCTVPVP